MHIFPLGRIAQKGRVVAQKQGEEKGRLLLGEQLCTLARHFQEAILFHSPQTPLEKWDDLPPFLLEGTY